MRTVTTNIFTFDELSNKAKEAARDWWRECEGQDPSWFDEHAGSLRAALKFIRSYKYADTLVDLYKTVEGFRSDPSKTCPWTGYCADAVAIAAIITAQSDGEDDIDRVQTYVERAMTQAWEAEVEYQMRADNVDESIRANEYEFTEAGGLRGTFQMAP